MRYFIKTYGCAANEADSERIETYLQNLGYKKAKDINTADYVVINTCMVRKSAENRVYGLINNLNKSLRIKNFELKIIVTGCMTGMAVKDKTGKFLKHLKEIFPKNVEFLPIEEIGFNIEPVRYDKTHALVPISFGCNNFCSFCVVPHSRGPEKSRPYDEILTEIKNLAQNGYTKITLLGMNVNSYGADLINSQLATRNPQTTFQLPNGKIIQPILVKHLGRTRIPTLFPYLLEDICHIKGIKEINFMSSNPWDFSDELIDVIAQNPQISRQLHLAVQSGSDRILKIMNRWYTKKEFLTLIKKIRTKIPNVSISTDIIVGFPGETEKDFVETVDLCQKAKFNKAYISIYSDRPLTFAHKNLKDNIPFPIKKQRWQILENLINKPSLKIKYLRI